LSVYGHDEVPCSEDGVGGFAVSAFAMRRAFLALAISTRTMAFWPFGRGTMLRPATGAISIYARSPSAAAGANTSGRNSSRGMPVMRSTSTTRLAGIWVQEYMDSIRMPRCRAKGVTPPAFSTTLLMISLFMEAY
jgi:hypothetical protein